MFLFSHFNFLAEQSLVLQYHPQICNLTKFNYSTSFYHFLSIFDSLKTEYFSKVREDNRINILLIMPSTVMWFSWHILLFAIIYFCKSISVFALLGRGVLVDLSAGALGRLCVSRILMSYASLLIMQLGENVLRFCPYCLALSLQTFVFTWIILRYQNYFEYNKHLL